MRLSVKIEIEGKMIAVGEITSTRNGETGFSYLPEYLSHPEAMPISVSLPLQKETFSAQTTYNFFNGLLPEGFTRTQVAQFIHADPSDYMSILHSLGQECLGAIQIEADGDRTEMRYERLSMDRVKALANEGATKSAEIVTSTHLSLTGATGKVGLYRAEDGWYLPKGLAPSTHILKQSHVRFDSIVMNEQLALMTAGNLGLPTPKSFIVNTGKSASDAEVLFATERFDRTFDKAAEKIDGLVCPLRLHQEDFAQALNVSAAEKYERGNEGYLRKMFDTLRAHSANPVEDQLILWRSIVFDYLIGNTDNHLKNFSLLYSKDLKTMRLSPVYDVLSTVIYEESTRDMAFHLGGENAVDRITEANFKEAAGEAGLGEKMAMRIFSDYTNRFERSLRDAAAELKAAGFRKAEALADRILRERWAALS